MPLPSGTGTPNSKKRKQQDTIDLRDDNDVIMSGDKAKKENDLEGQRRSDMDVDDGEHDENDHDDDLELDDEQLEEYQEMVDTLGNFPDKVKINSLSMVAEDYSESKKSAGMIYNAIRHRLLKTNRENMLPLVYVFDSILKNAKGEYLVIAENDIVSWMPVVYSKLQEPQRTKLQKVWRTWNEFQLFAKDKWERMGECFQMSSMSSSAVDAQSLSASGAGASSSGSFVRTQDGSRTLLLSSVLRNEMQNILDDMQRDVEDELEKVSLERLADMNPELLSNIKAAAEDALRNGGGNAGSGNRGGGVGNSFANGGERNAGMLGSPGTSLGKASSHASSNAGGLATTSTSSSSDHIILPPFFTEIRSPAVLQRARAWGELKEWRERKDYLEATHSVVTALQQIVRDGTSPGVGGGSGDAVARYTQKEAVDMIQYLAGASATASLLTAALERIQNQVDRKEHKANVSFPFADGGNHMGQSSSSSTSVPSRGFGVDRSDFTNDGIKKKNGAVIGMLYEVGLPFVSSSDGRRFATQLELSNHLDALFKRNQIEKTMARTEERGWYMAETVWTGESSADDGGAGLQSAFDPSAEAAAATASASEDYSPETSTVPADERRDRCVICGINFKMFFDNDDDVYKYRNCREIEILNDEVALNDSDHVLVHVSCWRGLGSPEVITVDQALQETLAH